MVNTFHWNNSIWNSLSMHIFHDAFDATMDLWREQKKQVNIAQQWTVVFPGTYNESLIP